MGLPRNFSINFVFRRALAATIDWFITVTPATAIYFLELGEWSRYTATNQAIIAIIYLGVLNSHVGNGQTIAKRFLQLCVTEVNGKPVSLVASFFRAIPVVICMNLLSILMWLNVQELGDVYNRSGIVIATIIVLGYTLLPLLQNDHRTMGDLLTKTVVVSEEFRGRSAAPASATVNWVCTAILIALLSWMFWDWMNGYPE